MKHWSDLGLEDFLASHPNFRIIEINGDKIELAGEYYLKAQLAGSQLIERTYQLRLVCPKDYPSRLPLILDTEGYFPRNSEYHTYSDGSFCLGSELKIKSILRNDHTFTAFFEKVVDRFLYAVSHRIEFGSFPYGELKHGEEGLIDDYGEMFGLKGKLSVLRMLKALGKRKREANKLHCPCGCRLRLGKCNYRFKLNEFRNLERPRWFRRHLTESFSMIEIPKKTKRKRLGA